MLLIMHAYAQPLMCRLLSGAWGAAFLPVLPDALAALIPHTESFNSAARLIRRLLRPDPTRRPTVQQVLDDDSCTFESVALICLVTLSIRSLSGLAGHLPWHHCKMYVAAACSLPCLRLQQFPATCTV